MFDFLNSVTSFFGGASTPDKKNDLVCRPTDGPMSTPLNPVAPAPQQNMSVAPRPGPLVCHPGDGPMSTPLNPVTPATTPSSADADEKADKDKPIDQKKMGEAAAKIFKACDGWGTNEDAIHEALRGKSAKEIAAIKQEYQNHYGKSLDAVLADEMDADSDDFKAVQAEMSGDPVKAAAAQLMIATTGQWGTNEDAVMETLRGLPEKQRELVAAEFAKQTGGQNLKAVLGDELSGGDKTAALLLADGKKDQADAALLDDAMNGGFLGLNRLNTDEDAINKVLEGRDAKEKEKLFAAYKEQTKGGDLQKDLVKNLDEGTEADLSGALLDGKMSDAAAIRIQIAASGAGTDEDAIFKQLSVADPKARQAIIDSFNQKYGKEWGGNLQNMLDDEMGKADPADPTGDNNLDRERASQLVSQGKLDPVFAMRYAMKGAGTDEDMLKDTLAELDPKQAESLQKAYEFQYGTSLKSDMDEELSGRDGHYIMQSLGGEKGLSLEERMRRADSDYDFERGSGAGIGKQTLDWLSEKADYTAGAQLDKQHDRLGAARAKMAFAATDKEKAEARAEVEQLMGYQTQDVDAFHASQDAVTNAAATTGGVIATVALTAATGGLGAAPAAALMMGTAGGGLASMGIKRALQGDAYGREAAGVDLAMTAVNTATAGLMASGPMVNALPEALAARGIGTFTQGVGGSFANQMATQVVQGGVGGIISGTAQGMMDEKTWRGPGNGALNVFKSIGGNMVGGIAGGVIQTGAGKIPGLDGDGIAPAFTTGFLGGAGGSAAQLAIDPNTYDGRFEDVMGRFGATAVPAGVQGGLLNAVQSVQHKKFLEQQRQKAAAEALANNKTPPPSVDVTPPPVVDVTPPPAVEVTPPPVVEVTPPVSEPQKLLPPGKEQLLLPPGKEQLLLPAHTETQPVITDGNNGGNGGGGGGGGGGGNMSVPDDQGHRDALVSLSKQAKTPEQTQQIKEWATEIDANNPKPMREALEKLQTEAKQDGVVTPTEGAALKTWDKEQASLPASEEHFDFKKANKDNKEAADRAKEIKKLEKENPDAAALLKPKEANPELSKDIKGFMAGADAARVSEDPKLAALQSQRAQFETAVAMSPEAQAAVKPMLDDVAAKALDYLQKMHGDGKGGINPDVMMKLGGEASGKNYAGAVGDDPAKLLEVMKSGNVRERMVALSEFQEKILGVDALNATADTPEGQAARKKMEALFGDGSKGGFSKEDLGRLLDRTETYRENTPADKLDGKAVFNPQGDEHKAYWDAKNQNMDTKLPAFTADAMQEQMGIDTGGKSTKIGEGNVLARSGMTIDEAQAMGLNLSQNEIDQMVAAQQKKGSGLKPGELPWVTGSKANMVDPNAQFIQDAKGNAMPLKAGISGTTARGMGLFDVMGVNQSHPELARLALMAQLNPIEAHSYHEIAVAANGYMKGESGSQFKYDVNNPYANMGLPPDVLAKIAAKNGMNFETLNNTPNMSVAEPTMSVAPNKSVSEPNMSTVEPTNVTKSTQTTVPEEQRMPRTVEEAKAAKENGESFTNKAIREDYERQNKGIPEQNKEWIKQGLSAEERAQKASELRHSMRMTSRELMGHDGEKLGLLVRDAKKYGDGEGPSFEQVKEGINAKRVKEGKPPLQGDALMEEIIDSSTRTDAETTKRATQEKPEKPPPEIDLPEGVTVHGDVVRLPPEKGQQEGNPVRIQRDNSNGKTRLITNEDGTVAVLIGKDCNPDIALQEVAEQIRLLVSRNAKK